MGLRQRLNDNPRLAAGVVGGCIALALLIFLIPRLGGPSQARDAGGDKQFFSIDDGKNWFTDDATKLPPFDKDGKPAYRVRVYRCAHGKEFVGHLERYADADLKRLREMIDTGKTNSMDFINLEMAVEAKLPGAKDWVKMTAQNASRTNALRMPKCPEGSTAGITRVSPSPS